MKHKGFTLIELLVVVAIVSLLASIVFTSLNSARSKGRDARRQEDVHQMQLALALYFNTNGSYPSSGGADQPSNSWSNSDNTNGNWVTLQTILATYLSKLPTDPKPSSGCSPSDGGCFNYIYYAFSGLQAYLIVYDLENAKGPDPGVYYAGQIYQYGGTGANTSIKTVGAS